ncbi:MAG: hypothetical protein QOG53_1664 [Frankiales bacterium]|jgi:uncharacterized membrane protein|nr:hypothetical protein [Frankiales bacterium]
MATDRATRRRRDLAVRKHHAPPGPLFSPVNIHHYEHATLGERAADRVAAGFGSWRYLGYQTAGVTVWLAINAVGLFALHWDPYPFILLNLIFSTQASYAAPLILLAQNRQADRDRMKAEHDYRVNERAEAKIDLLLSQFKVPQDVIDAALRRVEPDVS